MKRAGRWRGPALALGVLLAVLAAACYISQRRCPRRGFAVSQGMRAFVMLKNRTALPRAEDFDGRATLDALLQPGDDRGRWSETRAASVEGFVVGVERGGVEAANCYSLTNRDAHVYLALRPDAPPRERLVAEVTPRLHAWAEGRGLDWSEETLRRELIGRRVRVEGWMLFDIEHDGESENTAPGRAQNWRATAWELHPITSLEVIR